MAHILLQQELQVQAKRCFDVRAMLACLGVLLLLLLLRSRDRFRVGEPGISRVDVILLFVCFHP